MIPVFDPRSVLCGIPRIEVGTAPWRTLACLKKASLSIDFGIFKMGADISEDDRQCAWELYTEMVPHVAVMGKPADEEATDYSGEVLAESLEPLHPPQRPKGFPEYDAFLQDWTERRRLMRRLAAELAKHYGWVDVEAMHRLLGKRG